MRLLYVLTGAKMLTARRARLPVFLCHNGYQWRSYICRGSCGLIASRFSGPLNMIVVTPFSLVKSEVRI
jgi:hypothetical protein